MKKLMASALGLLLASAPFASVQAENINIYGWQNWSYEWVSADGPSGGSDRDVDRLSNNAANIGFMSHMDTGITGLQVGFRCEQFTYWGRLNNYTNWCNRNSKISLRHEQFGEIMFGQWLLPYNEIVAQWVDPFYDAGADSHTSIMGNLGANASRLGSDQLFYNGSFSKASDFTDTYGATAFNRRQEGVIQYVWPNTSAMADQSRQGIQFRFAITQGSDTDKDVSLVESNTVADRTFANLDERIWSTGVSYQHNMGNDQLWLAAAYERHDDLTANSLRGEARCDDSDNDGFRLAARYKKDWGNGQATWIAAMYEDLNYDADGCLLAARDAVDLNNDGDMNDADEAAIPNNTPVGMSITNGNTTLPWSDVDRDSWMISGKHTFGNGMDFRFSYMDADEWDCGNVACRAGQEDDTDAVAYNLGLFYTMPAGTELRVTYSEVDNEDNAQYDFGINGGGAQLGEDIDMLAVGIVHWFD